MNNTFFSKFLFGNFKKNIKKATFDLPNNQRSVTSYCRQMIITIEYWIKKLILQGLDMLATEHSLRSPGPEIQGEREQCLRLISAAARLAW